jgi:hypothetical protein
MVRIIQCAPLRKRFHIPRLQNVQTGNEARPASYSIGTGFLLRGVNRPKRDVNHALPPSATVKNEWSCTSAPHGVGKENFTFTASKSWQFAYESRRYPPSIFKVYGASTPALGPTQSPSQWVPALSRGWILKWPFTSIQGKVKNDVC